VAAAPGPRARKGKAKQKRLHNQLSLPSLPALTSKTGKNPSETVVETATSRREEDNLPTTLVIKGRCSTCSAAESEARKKNTPKTVEQKEVRSAAQRVKRGDGRKTLKREPYVRLRKPKKSLTNLKKEGPCARLHQRVEPM